MRPHKQGRGAAAAAPQTFGFIFDSGFWIHERRHKDGDSGHNAASLLIRNRRVSQLNALDSMTCYTASLAPLTDAVTGILAGLRASPVVLIRDAFLCLSTCSTARTPTVFVIPETAPTYVERLATLLTGDSKKSQLGARKLDRSPSLVQALRKPRETWL